MNRKRPGSSGICGAAFPMTMAGSPMAVCVKSPKHRGEHGCTIMYKWPNTTFLSDGAVVLTSRFKAPKGKLPYILMAMNRKRPEAHESQIDLDHAAWNKRRAIKPLPGHTPPTGEPPERSRT